MNKQKKTYTSTDISQIVKILQKKLVTLRLSNIYDVNQKTYVFKFQRGDKKECLLIESGSRIHTTNQPLTKKLMPSGFTMKFRKNIKGKSLESINQIGVERVLDLKFANSFHLILEFYSQGNIILTDGEYNIIQCVRSHQYEEGIGTAVGMKYPFEKAAGMGFDSFNLSKEKIEELSQDKEEVINPKMIKKFQKSQGKKIKDIIFKLIPCFSPQQIEHFIKKEGFNPNEKMLEIETIQKICQNALEFLKDLMKNTEFGGYIISLEQEKETFIEFTPFLMKQHEDQKYTYYKDFDEALDIYFQNIQIKVEKNEEENKRIKILQNIKIDQERRLKKLQSEKEEFISKAELIERNLQDIDAIINIINMMINGGLSWTNIMKQIQESRKQGDPLAMIIYQINWLENEVIVLLEDPSNINNDLIPISINFKFNAFQNADRYYQQKKKHDEKEKKTQEAMDQAIKKTHSVKIELEKNKVKVDVLNARKPFWFEKFYWFITSENYLVLSGRDQQQNELLVKKYLNKDDLYMHADYHGASSTIIKNHNPKFKVPFCTLQEASVAAICRSKAWDSKIISAVWYVYASQVSKSAPSGEYLPTGSFMIRGKKNFLYPQRLEMSFALVFRLDESCLEKHKNERKVREALEDQIQNESEIQEVTEVVGIENNPNIKDVWTKKHPQNQQQQQNQQQTKNAKKDNKKDNKKDSKKKEKIQEIEEEQISQKQINQKPKRGQKTKIEKMKKYQDQDDDEKEIKLKLLGAKKTKFQIQQEQFEKQNNKEQLIEIQKIEEKIIEKVEEKVDQQLVQKTEQNVNDNDKSNDEDDDNKSQQSEKSIEEIKPQIDNEEEHEEIVENQQDWLTGCPKEDDTYFFCIPMCAPYISVQQNYKYKIKLTPGILKKGKAAKQALYLFQAQQDANLIDKKLMRNMTDNELVLNMIGNVKVSGQGLQKLKDKEKMEKKKAKKEQEKAKE